MKLQNLSGDDRLFLRRIEDCAKATEKYKTAQFTKFVSPHECAVFRQFADISPFVLPLVWGGWEQAERCIIGFFPDFADPAEEHFPICALRITAMQEIGHREILGSVLGLGIERFLIGDILPQEKEAVLLCLDSIADFIQMNLTHVGRQKVSVQTINLSEMTLAPKQMKEISGTVASLRLDSVLGLAMGKSRTKAHDFIAAGLVQKNWLTEENPSCMVAEGDILSVRGMGRMKLSEVQGISKKGRIWVVIEQYI